MLSDNKTVYIVWVGTGLCGHGNGDLFVDKEKAESFIKKFLTFETWDSEKLQSTELNECGEPFSYVQQITIDSDLFYAIAQLIHFKEKHRD